MMGFYIQSLEVLCATDLVFDAIVKQFGVPKIPIREPGFATLVLLILEQQVSIDSAKAAFLKLQKIVDLEPEALLRTDDESFRSCGISRQKTKYIRCLAEAIIDKSIDLESLGTKTADVVRAELIKIKGIGNWTIDVYLMFCLKSPDILPLGDIAVVNTIKELWQIESRVEMEIYTQKWVPHRSMATFLIWHYYLKKRKRTIEY